MDSILANDKLLLFVLFVFPGLVSMQFYRILMPAKAVEWSTAIQEGLFYSVLNIVLCFPLLYLNARYDSWHAHLLWCWFSAMIVLLAAPILWPILFVKAIRSKLMRGLQLPFPTAWDAFFDRREPCFLLIHLKDGSMIGGYYGPGSFAGAFPHDGDLYISVVYHLDEEGLFGEPVPDSKGVLLRKEDYDYIEVFDIPANDATS